MCDLWAQGFSTHATAAAPAVCPALASLPLKYRMEEALPDAAGGLQDAHSDQATY